MKRDFTYIDDIVEGIVRLIDKVPNDNPDWSGEKLNPGTSYPSFKIYCIGNSQPVKLIHFINILEKTLRKKVKSIFTNLARGCA